MTGLDIIREQKKRRGLIAAALQFGRMTRSLARAAKLVEARTLRGRQ